MSCKHQNLMRHHYTGQTWWQCDEGCDFIFREGNRPQVEGERQKFDSQPGQTFEQLSGTQSQVASRGTAADWLTALAPYNIRTPEQAAEQLRLAHEFAETQRERIGELEARAHEAERLREALAGLLDFFSDDYRPLCPETANCAECDLLRPKVQHARALASGAPSAPNAEQIIEIDEDGKVHGDIDGLRSASEPAQLTADKLKQIAPLELERRATNAAYRTWNDLVSLVNFIGVPNTKQKAIAAMKMRFLEQFSDDGVNKQAR